MILRLVSLIRWTSWVYLAFVVLLWGMIFFGGDLWWPATVVLYGPRWCAALPLIVLAPLAACFRRRSLAVLLLGALIVFGPLMGFNLASIGSEKPVGPVLRIISCNLDNGKFRADALLDLILESGADIVALQEYPDNRQLKLPPGWQMVEQRGLAILSHLPLRQGVVVPVFNPPDPWPINCLLHCVVATPAGELDVCSIHLPTPRFGLLNVLDKATLLRPSRNGLLLQETAYRERASAEVKRAVIALTRPLIIAGDFNMPVDSAIYRKVWNGYRNAFRTVGNGYGFTQRVTVKGLTVAVRIDHVLTGEGLAPKTCQVGPDVGSGHLPLITDIELVKR